MAKRLKCGKDDEDKNLKIKFNKLKWKIYLNRIFQRKIKNKNG